MKSLIFLALKSAFRCSSRLVRICLQRDMLAGTRGSTGILPAWSLPAVHFGSDHDGRKHRFESCTPGYPVPSEDISQGTLKHHQLEHVEFILVFQVGGW